MHKELITKNGVFNIENSNLDELAADGAYEVSFVFTRTRLKGATGSAVRPIGIR